MRTTVDWYDRQGAPLSMEAAAKLLVDHAYKCVAVDDVGGYRVSTVWLGLDHQYGDGPPLIFETMLFGDGPRNEECHRYATEGEAKEGHRLLVTELEG